ncbi:hypothetical protein AWM75_06880 [Aerococcus urinaehominis]|uniref:Uncharacterized protein n=1 Tax=Aerococcus urinaehominis TaxID=128944 RepID=A0A0X8FLY8_9LACT|nr:YutD family protein [Aerococcus urinaehominis]AMB99725.1 hypothetical protein AWM75_06880 [Aerococcus urinaehominis]SDL92023.1 Uncharacterized protein YutD [Aerococcus urinaehominis]
MAEHKNKQELARERVALDYPLAEIHRVSEDRITINGQYFSLIRTYGRGLDLDHLSERYTDYLDQFDYIVGDWSHDQLRLRGFYDNDMRGVALNQKIRFLDDYLLEYCSFACPYFVLGHERSASEKADNQAQILKQRRKDNRSQHKKPRKRRSNRRHFDKSKSNYSHKNNNQSAGHTKNQSKSANKKNHYHKRQRQDQVKPASKLIKQDEKSRFIIKEKGEA